MGMQTLVIGIIYIVIGFISEVMLITNPEIGQYLFLFTILLGFAGWFVIHFGNNLSWYFAQMKFYKTGTKNLDFHKDKSGNYHFLFLDPKAKAFNIKVKTLGGITDEPISIGKADGKLAGSNMAVTLSREGVHQTFGIEDQIKLGLEGAYIGNLVDEVEALALKQSGIFSNSDAKKNQTTILIVGLVLIISAIALFYAYQNSQQLTSVQSSLDTIATAVKVTIDHNAGNATDIGNALSSTITGVH